MSFQKSRRAMTRAQTIAEIDAAMRKAEEALRHRDPDALAGRVGDIGKIRNDQARDGAKDAKPMSPSARPDGGK